MIVIKSVSQSQGLSLLVGEGQSERQDKCITKSVVLVDAELAFDQPIIELRLGMV